MNPILAISIAKALIEAAQDGIPLVVKVAHLLKASDEPEAKSVLAELHAAYDISSIEADAALDAASKA